MNLSIIMLPMIISGVQFGIIFNILMPDIIIVIFYDVLLGYVVYGLFKKIRMLMEKEKKAKDATAAAEEGPLSATVAP